MPTPVERVIQTYSLMVNLSAEQQEDARLRLEKFLEGQAGSDQQLAVLGLQYLRGGRRPRRHVRLRSAT